jgi:hypothetical protein
MISPFYEATLGFNYEKDAPNDSKQPLQGLSHEIDFKHVDKNLHTLA